MREHTLTTDRLILRPMVEADAESLFRLHADIEAARLLPRAPHTHLEQTKSVMRRVLAQREAGTTMGFAVTLRESGAMIGVAGIHHIERDNDCAQIAYEIERAHAGRGLMTEGVARVLELAFREVALHRIEARIDPRNVRSIRLVERLGFAKEGVLREHFKFEGRFYDTAIYARLSHEGVREGDILT